MVNAASDLRDTPFGAPTRSLNHDVLQSAEEAVLANPDAVDTLQSPDAAVRADRRVTTEGLGSDRVARIVAERPLQSALAAMLAGGLLVALTRRVLSRRQQ